MSREHIIAIDPGLKPGVVEFEIEDGRPRVVRVSHKLESWLHNTTPWDLVVTELQWYHPGGKATPNSLMKLAFRAGFTLASVHACRRMALAPEVWRGALGFGKGITKEQVQKRIAAQLTAQEKRAFLDIPAARHGDVLDSIGIGRAAILLRNTTTEHDVVFGK